MKTCDIWNSSKHFSCSNRLQVAYYNNLNLFVTHLEWIDILYPTFFRWYIPNGLLINEAKQAFIPISQKRDINRMIFCNDLENLIVVRMAGKIMGNMRIYVQILPQWHSLPTSTVCVLDSSTLYWYLEVPDC